MKPRAAFALLSVLAGGALLSVTVKHPAAQAAPVAAAAAPGPVADILSGKDFPNKLTPTQIDASYHLVSIVDPQGKPGTYATKGDTVTLGGETFLVAYFVPLTSGVGKPPQPKPDEPAQLGLINMRYITVLYDIRTVAPTAPAKETDTPG